jgi:hypothetical protein
MCALRERTSFDVIRTFDKKEPFFVGEVKVRKAISNAFPSGRSCFYRLKLHLLMARQFSTMVVPLPQKC